jgi:hypothetical protein
MVLAQTVLGVVVLVATAADIVVTTTSVSSGRGPLSAQVAARVWAVVLAVHRRTRGHRLLQAAGPVILFGIIVTWVALLSIGWALVLAAPGALQDASAGFPARLHFAAVTVAGRGSSALEITDGAWWIVEQLCGLTGVALIGLSIAYVLPVVRAVAQKRQVASAVSVLGASPQEVLRSCWDGETFGDLDLHLINLAGLVNVTTQMHLAYPVLYYFHTPYRDFALAPSVVVLDETLTLIERALERRPGLSDSAWHPTRAAVDQLLRVVRDSVVGLDPETPPRPNLDGLRRDGLPLRSPERIAEGIAAVAGRRRVLRALLAFEGRSWPPDDELRAHDRLGAGGGSPD